MPLPTSRCGRRCARWETVVSPPAGRLLNTPPRLRGCSPGTREAMGARDTGDAPQSGLRAVAPGPKSPAAPSQHRHRIQHHPVPAVHRRRRLPGAEMLIELCRFWVIFVRTGSACCRLGNSVEGEQKHVGSKGAHIGRTHLRRRWSGFDPPPKHGKPRENRPEPRVASLNESAPSHLEWPLLLCCGRSPTCAPHPRQG